MLLTKEFLDTENYQFKTDENTGNNVFLVVSDFLKGNHI